MSFRVVPLAALAAALLSAPAAHAATATYEAESGTLTGGAVVAADHSGYVGSGFVGGYTDGNKGLARTSFAVTAPAAGTHSLTVRYANGTGSAQTLSLYVNGAKVQQISLPATANWDTWGTVTVSAALTSGANTVALAFDAADSGNVNLDDLAVTSAGAPPAGRYEAESATLAGGAVSAADHAGFTGTGFAGGFTDGNKGTASATFAISTASAGAAPVTVRYANGTGSAKTLSLYLNGVKSQQISLPATANWDTWGTAAFTVTVPSGGSSLSVRFDAADSGNVNLDHVVVGTPTPGGGGGSDGGADAREAESAFFSGGPSAATSVSGFSGTGHLTGFSATGARVVFTLGAAQAGNAPVVLRYANTSGAGRTLSLYANGLRTGQIALPAGAGWQTVTTSVPLRAGLNTLSYQRDSGDSGDVAIDRINGGTALAARGATLPYTAYEAESGTTNGTTLAADRTYKSVASESSGRRAVRLASTGQHVQVTLTRPANALTVRYSIPDNAAGTGTDASLSLYANGTHVKDLALTSRYSWVYGAYPYDNNPAGGEAHRFYDETRTLIGDWPAGTVLKLQKDSGDTASAYTIDVLDAEQVAPAETVPAGFTAATGANDGVDDTASLTSQISAAKAAGKGLWLPAGRFDISARINVAGITIRGAGPWHTTVHGKDGKGGFFATGGDVRISDLTVTGDATRRDDAGHDAAFEGNFGTGSLLANVFVQHSKVALWADNGTNGLYVVGLRIRDTYADGVNLHGNVVNTRIDQSSVRNTGDDALAMWSDGAAVTNSAFTFNTLQLPMLANTAAIYGGNGNRITDNLLSDTVNASAGIAVGTRFNPVPLSGTTVVARNTLTRTGGDELNWGSQLGALWIYADTADISAPIAVTDNVIKDSTHQGVLLSWGKSITNVTFDKLTIDGAGTFGIDVNNVTGSASFANTTVTGAASGGLNNPGSFTIVRGSGNSGF